MDFVAMVTIALLLPAVLLGEHPPGILVQLASKVATVAVGKTAAVVTVAVAVAATVVATVVVAATVVANDAGEASLGHQTMGVLNGRHTKLLDPRFWELLHP